VNSYFVDDNDFDYKRDSKNDHEYDTKDDGDDYNSSNEDYSDDGDEDIESYKVGGYHPVHVGEMYNKRYLVVEKMGWGHFSTVWMCQDTMAPQSSPPQYVAMKVQKSAPHYREAAFDEIELLTSVKTVSESLEVEQEYGPNFNYSIVKLLDHFDHVGPHGKHVCMVFELLGENLLKVIKNYDYHGISIPVVQNLTRQICLGLDFLHRNCQIIHTDLKPENILIAVAPIVSHTPKILHSTTSASQNNVTEKSVEKSKKKTVQKKGSTKPLSGSTKKTVSKISDGAVSNDVNSSVNNSGGNDQSLLSPEQKKKIKKKLKKKRQQARKSDKGGSARRKQGQLTSLEKLKEMQLMERASLPTSYEDTLSNSNLNETMDSEYNSELNTSADATESIHLSTSAEAKLSSKMGGYTVNAKDEDEYEDMCGGVSITVQSLSPPRPSGTDAEESIYSPWMRDSLLTTVNFSNKLSVPNHDEASPSNSIIVLSDEEWVYPPTLIWSVIHMVIII
jgi:serine/threonine protein kinase